MRKKTFIIGVTGVIGSGKSEVCRRLRDEFGFQWISADILVHDLYKAGRPGYVRIKEFFGDAFVSGKEVLRGRLRRFILGSHQKLWILNKVIHPLVLHEVNKKITQINALNKAEKRIPVCIEAAYFEKEDLGKFVDRILRIDARDEVIMARLRQRKISQKDLGRLLLFQRKTMSKEGLLLQNNASLEELELSLHKVVSSLMVE